VHRFEQWPRSSLSNVTSLIRRSAPDLALDSVQLSDARQRLASKGGSMSLLQVKEFAADMCPTRRFLDATTFVDPVEAGITIGLQRPMKIAQVLLWMITFTIRRVGEPDRR
jgi:hypothetical protein